MKQIVTLIDRLALYENFRLYARYQLYNHDQRCLLKKTSRRHLAINRCSTTSHFPQFGEHDDIFCNCIEVLPPEFDAVLSCIVAEDRCRPHASMAGDVNGEYWEWRVLR